MKQVSFYLNKQLYRKITSISGRVSYLRGGEVIDPQEYDEAEHNYKVGCVMAPIAPQLPEDLLWAIQNHIKVASN